MQSITITHDHLTEARDLTEQARATNDSPIFTEVCIVAVAARHVDSSVYTTGFQVIHRQNKRGWIASRTDADTLYKIISAFDGKRDADCAALLPFTFTVREL